MFDTVDEIVAGIEQALELERELGVRSVEFDRAQFQPPAPVQQPQRQVVAASSQQSSVIERTGGSPPAQLNQSPATAHQSPTTAHQSPITNHQSPTTDFAFIMQVMPKGEAAEMLAKMIKAMGYAQDEVLVVTAQSVLEQKPSARIYIVLGSDAFRTFAPGQRAALGMWTKVNDVPTIVTYSPTRILSYYGNDADGLTKAKRQIWSDLKSALAHINK